VRRIQWIVAVAVSTACAFALGIALAQRAFGPPRARGDSRTAVLNEVRSELANRYYRAVPSRILGLDSVDAMLAALDDPYTTYLDPISYEALADDAAARFPGVGLSVIPARDGVRVAAARRGPARDAGVRTGDVIVGVDRVPLGSVSFDEALGLMRGRAGTTVRLLIRRGSQLLEFVLVRRTVAMPSVSSALASEEGKRVGYLRVSEFRADAARELRLAVAELDREHPSGIVLDLRGNPGGLLDQAIDVTSLFLDRGVIVSVSGAHQTNRVYRARGHATTNLPLVVLVDGGSASSAEIVAAALRDNGRAEIVGERTFGKALVQSVEPLPDGGALKLTTAHYVTPAGVDIANRGIEPDVRVRDRPGSPVDEALAAAIRTLSASTM
jgi:carboxyl-terminal processing protease